MATSERKGRKYKLLAVYYNLTYQSIGTNSLSPQKMSREPFLQWIHLVIPFTPLMQDHINNLVMLAYILCRGRDDIIHDFAEE